MHRRAGVAPKKPGARHLDVAARVAVEPVLTLSGSGPPRVAAGTAIAALSRLSLRQERPQLRLVEVSQPRLSVQDHTVAVGTVAAHLDDGSGSTHEVRIDGKAAPADPHPTPLRVESGLDGTHNDSSSSGICTPRTI